MDAACCECPLSWHNSDCLECAGPAQAPLPSYIGTSAAQTTFCLETIDREEFSDVYAGVDLHICGQTVDFGKDSILIPSALRIRTRLAKHNHDDGNHADFQTNLDSHSDSQPPESSNQHDGIHLVKDGCDEVVQTKYKNDLIISELVTLISAPQS